MLRLLADENFNGIVVRHVRHRCPGLDLVTAHGARISGFLDPDVHAWAADEDRIVLTHDHRTMIDDAKVRMNRGEPMPGLFVFQGMTIGKIIDELEIAVKCSTQSEWVDVVQRFPM